MGTQIGVTHSRGDERAYKEVEVGSTTEAIGGAAAVVLAILGLIGVLPTVLDSIAVIAVGIALMIAGGAIARSYARAVSAAEPAGTSHQVVRGMGMEAMAGVAGIVLGILALLGIASPTLLSISAIVLGAALLMAGGAMARLESVLHSEVAAGHTTTHDSVYVATGSEVLVGVGAIVLGILGLSGHDPVTLSLVAMLAIGASVLLSGSSLAARFFGVFH